jgi:hypothetical protein
MANADLMNRPANGLYIIKKKAAPVKYSHPVRLPLLRQPYRHPRTLSFRPAPD